MKKNTYEYNIYDVILRICGRHSLNIVLLSMVYNIEENLKKEGQYLTPDIYNIIYERCKELYNNNANYNNIILLVTDELLTDLKED